MKCATHEREFEWIDEAEIVVAMASEWLHLDAADDWIRHDSGIVSSFLLF